MREKLIKLIENDRKYWLNSVLIAETEIQIHDRMGQWYESVRELEALVSGYRKGLGECDEMRKYVEEKINEV